MEASALKLWLQRWLAGFPPENVWIGCTAENQEEADRRIPHLLKAPAAKRFLSVEPLLGPLDLEQYLWPGCIATREEHDRECGGGMWCDERSIDWIIVGGESGPGARPMQMSWVRSIIEQCGAADVPCFVKQLGRTVIDDISYVGSSPGLKFCDAKGGDPSEWPDEFRLRQVPVSL